MAMQRPVGRNTGSPGVEGSNPSPSALMGTDARVLAIVNSAAGAGGSLAPDDALAACRELIPGLDCLRAAESHAAVEAVADAVRGERPPALIVAVGGDGTARGVAEGIARGLGRWPSERRGGGVLLRDGWPGEGSSAGPAPLDREPGMLVLPAGSGNSAYAALWGERPWQEALRAALDGSAPRRHVDLVRLAGEDRATLLGVNVGLITAIAREIEERKRADPGAGGDSDERYWAAFSSALERFVAPRVRVSVDGEPLHEGAATLCTIGGVRRFGRGAFDLLPQALLDDGLLDVCVVAEVSPERLGELAHLVPSGTHVGEPEVAYAQGRQVAVESNDGSPLAIEHDGPPTVVAPVLALELVRAAGPAPCAPGDTLLPAPAGEFAGGVGSPTSGPAGGPAGRVTRAPPTA